MKVYELSDDLTGLCHKGKAQEHIKIKVGDKLLEIRSVKDTGDNLIIEAEE